MSSADLLRSFVVLDSLAPIWGLPVTIWKRPGFSFHDNMTIYCMMVITVATERIYRKTKICWRFVLCSVLAILQIICKLTYTPRSLCTRPDWHLWLFNAHWMQPINYFAWRVNLLFWYPFRFLSHSRSNSYESSPPSWNKLQCLVMIVST